MNMVTDNDLLYEILDEILADSRELNQIIAELDEYTPHFPVVATALSICLENNRNGCSQPLGNG